MKKKFMLIIFLIIFSIGTNLSYAYEESNLNYKTMVPRINIKDKKENLYVQFSDQNHEFEKFVRKNYVLLDKMQKKYNISDKISINNWEEYENVIKKEYNENNLSSENKEMIDFFDIFENKYKNDEIINKVKYKDFEGLEFLLPSNSDYVENEIGKGYDLDNTDISIIKRQKELGISFRATKLPNMNSAISYAIKYAKNPNTKKYHYFRSGDCANFVSQILEAGGVKQTVYKERHKGWWHTTGNWHIPFVGSEHQHSQAWSMADTFVRYMGISSTTTNHETFSARINKGTIIAADFSNDGDWDHVAFVVAADNYSKNYSGKKYYDYKVAQHTSNYLAWTSSSENGWENIKGRFAIVRQ
ncbi:amidase domain-containing protein [Helcococcus kunzii]|uniref:Putative amidase domain-containing protein n=1 Tax=Helcococcus kunzii ATCC 51366 TaxID=883114 RepID=H3NPU2_9FIRM|nr:amidase domain-containing protein [Helcococcus kunzii]EHR33320.1 hypothetical protein HMPREF9709_01364 [Helcococcus kunzii ATCC 51366]MCT1795976.1 amidase domain-containing protein [Helcococcus kunzii]MCT1988248.1 amidase domain-containing protein [Helcococcus kunzii]